MNDLRDIIAYYMRNYPHADDLSKARLTKMVYLADWKSAIDNGCQITGISWYFDNYGPYKADVYQAVLANQQIFGVRYTSNQFGDRKTLLCLLDQSFQPQLDSAAESILQHVIEETQMLGWTDFISLVYGTYPINVSPRYTELDLVSLAEEYRGALKADKALQKS